MSQPEAEFLGIFRDEANERLDSMSTALLAIEDGRASGDAIDSLFRDAHTIKGGAGMLGLDSIGVLAHAVEDVLAAARQTGDLPTGFADPLLRACDALRALVNGDDAADPDAIAALIAELASEPAPAPPPLRVVKTAETPPVEAPPVVEPTQSVEAPPAVVERRSAPAEAQPARAPTVRVPAEKLDALLDLVGETVLHRQRLGHLVAAGDSAQHEELSDELDHGDRLLGALQDAAIQTRTLPFGSITGPFPRAIRDIANAEGKEVELVVEGTETELDRVILEGISEPLVHMLRNAVAHGIEPPAERAAAGKHARGRVVLGAEQRGGLVAVIVDGRRARRLARAARAGRPRGLARRSPGAPGLLDPHRGQRSRRSRCRVRRRQGARRELRRQPPDRERAWRRHVRHAASAAHARAARRPPRRARSPRLRRPAGERAGSNGRHGDALAQRAQVARPAWRLVPLGDLAELLGVDAPPLPPRAPAIVVAAGGRRVALACDRLIGESEVVVKALGPLLASVRGIPRRRDSRRRPRRAPARSGQRDRKRRLASARASPSQRPPASRVRRGRCSSSRTRSWCASCSGASSRRPGIAW